MVYREYIWLVEQRQVFFKIKLIYCTEEMWFKNSIVLYVCVCVCVFTFFVCMYTSIHTQARTHTHAHTQRVNILINHLLFALKMEQVLELTPTGCDLHSTLGHMASEKTIHFGVTVAALVVNKTSPRSRLFGF